ncbi:hypothetical protein M0Q97_01015 [Candidatus Dojkabacteria bacterium]|jgi:hypothetical protein|nr:hypothetical protein [Candidatus Dojkabacteria bacterium]
MEIKLKYGYYPSNCETIKDNCDAFNHLMGNFELSGVFSEALIIFKKF